jgi:hypothetical protein
VALESVGALALSRTLVSNKGCGVVSLVMFHVDFVEAQSYQQAARSTAGGGVPSTLSFPCSATLQGASNQQAWQVGQAMAAWQVQIKDVQHGALQHACHALTPCVLLWCCSGPTSRLSQICEWLSDGDYVVVFDECHKAKNCITKESSKWVGVGGRGGGY